MITIVTWHSKGPITPAIYLTIAIVWSNRCAMGYPLLSGHIHTCDCFNYCHYNARNGSRNRKRLVNRKCDWTLDINENIFFFLKFVVCCSVSLIKHTIQKQKYKIYGKVTCCVAVPAWRRVQDVYFFITRIVYSSCSPFLLLRLFVFLYKIH